MSNEQVIFDPGVSLAGVDVSVVLGSGWQALSTPYHYRVCIQVMLEGGLDDSAIDELLRNPVRLAFGTAGLNEVHGVVRELEACTVRTGEAPRYWLTIVPRLHYLELTRHTRVFQDASHLDIVKAVLEEHGFVADTHYLDRCNRSYPTHDYTVQYQETDFDFVSRLMEHVGIHYHFVQGATTEKMVLGDDNNAFQAAPDLETLTYDERTGESEDDEPVVVTLSRFRRSRASKVVVRDYDWRAPTQPLRFEHVADATTGHGVLDFYGDHFRADGDGADFARLRSEEHMVASDVVRGQTPCRAVVPGAKFTLTGHPNPDLDREYVVTACDEEVSIRSGEGYVRTFEAIPSAHPFRPARRAPRPNVAGFVNAKIDGAHRSTATPIDDLGRYKVVIPFDERGKGGGKASRWVRAAQPSAGSAYGFHAPLHIGTEVVVAHVNGDPDRPVIVGAIPNAETESPVVAPNARHSRMKTGSGIVVELDDDC